MSSLNASLPKTYSPRPGHVSIDAQSGISFDCSTVTFSSLCILALGKSFFGTLHGLARLQIVVEEMPPSTPVHYMKRRRGGG